MMVQCGHPEAGPATEGRPGSRLVPRALVSHRPRVRRHLSREWPRAQRCPKARVCAEGWWGESAPGLHRDRAPGGTLLSGDGPVRPCAPQLCRTLLSSGNLEKTPGSLQSVCPGAGGLTRGFDLADDEPEPVGRLHGVRWGFGVRRGLWKTFGPSQFLVDLMYSVWLFNWEVKLSCASGHRALGCAGGGLSRSSGVAASGL